MCRYTERLKAKAEGATLLTYTWLRGGLEINPKDRDEVNRRDFSECDG